jgi:hypothetical protein
MVDGTNPSDGSWTLTVARSDLADTRRLTSPVPEPAHGEALLRVEKVGLTANNVTYAVLGEAFRYWEFFPTESGRGVVPLWGFAEIVESRVEGLATGGRVYGYLPSASHLLVRPGRVDERGFRETAEHRATLPSPYNTYALTTADPAYEADREDLQVLFRPLFWTSFMLADWLIDNDAMGAQRIVFSSASSKTAYGAAFELHRNGRQVVGLTSPRNVAFTEGLGCYDAVLPYDSVTELSPGVPTLYADLAGEPRLADALRTRLGDALVHQVVVGVTHQQPQAAGTLADTGPAMFFAPDQMRKRIGDWGREGLDQRFADAWRTFAPVVAEWVDVVEAHGPDGLERVWQEVLSGRADPRSGHVVTL